MPAVWTQPITWQVDQLVTAENLNQQLRDNLEYLLRPNHQHTVHDNGTNYSFTSLTAFEDIDPLNLSLQLTTHGGPVLVYLQAVARTSGSSFNGYVTIAINAISIVNYFNMGLAHITTQTNTPLAITLMIPNLPAGTHIIRPQCRTATGSTLHFSSSSTTNPFIFGAIEL